MQHDRKTICQLLCAGAALSIAGPASAAFFDDSKAAVELRNFYMNRDFRTGTAPSKAEEWAQGFILKFESGYTEGPIGFGVDALGLL
ncbi:OprD family porin, partial [Pseudomonas stutzeri]|uniref:OprD family outer membrane porin n=1 Tax=Stutzerimonas stutzeri TaxID=316 RepID=UPI00210D681B